jgi:hypothetical protein
MIESNSKKLIQTNICHLSGLEIDGVKTLNSDVQNPILVRSFICWAIESTEISDEFLFFISTRDLNSQPSGI